MRKSGFKEDAPIDSSLSEKKRTEVEKNEIAQNNGAGDLPPELTARQQQILELMQAGKVNKEIANKLGIGVGTVKQHIVALFKKLHVSNRAMAVSRGMSMQQDLENRNAALTTTTGIMERRPCVVLSIALPENADPQAVRKLHGIMAALAFDNDALFLARKGNAGDIILGIHRVTEYDLIKALHTAQAVFDELLVFDAALASKLRGGLTVGLAGASMNRFGGWTGEAIASVAISAARNLLDDAVASHLAIGQPAQDLMQALGIGNDQEVFDTLPFSELGSLHWTGDRSSYGLVGRHAELVELEAALEKTKNGQGCLIRLAGESGMGKSRLCKEILKSCIQLGGHISCFRCLPLVVSKNDFINTLNGDAHSIDELVRLLDVPLADLPDLLIVDDFHIISSENQLVLAAAAAREAAKGRLVILSGRKSAESLSGVHEILLQRLPTPAVVALVREVLGDHAAEVRTQEIHSLVHAAAGVPLFAVEMAKHLGDKVPAFPLLVIICARLDSLRLDRELLRCVARSDGCLTMKMAVKKMGGDTETFCQSLDMAVAAGVLILGTDGYILFAHPLLRQIIDFLGME